MLSDQQNYDTFEYDEPDDEIPKMNAPPLPPARNKLKDFKNATLPRFNPMQPPSQDDSMEENYECFENEKVEGDPPFKKNPPLPNRRERPKLEDDSMEENYECFEYEKVEDDPPFKKNPPVPNRREKPKDKPKEKPKEKPKLEKKPQLHITKFKFSDLTKSKENTNTKRPPQPTPKDSFQSEINNKVKGLHLTGKDPSLLVNRKKSINSDQPIKAPKRNSSDNIHPPPQQVQQEQEDTDEEDPREVYADACDVRLFLQNKPWYFGKLDREAEESLLNDIKQNGAFLLRDSSKASITHPFTLTVYTNNHFYRLKIRHLESGKFVVGEKKESEIKFNTIPDLITYYQTEPLLLLATANNSNSCTTLKYIPGKNKGLNL